MPPGPKLVPPTEPAAPAEVPRGRLVNAQWIVKEKYTTPDGQKLVDERWVRDNMPYKQVHSKTRVFWYDKDVDAIIAEAARSGVKLKDVKLDHLERKAS